MYTSVHRQTKEFDRKVNAHEEILQNNTNNNSLLESITCNLNKNTIYSFLFNELIILFPGSVSARFYVLNRFELPLCSSRI